MVLDADPVRARATARPGVEFYLGLRNYVATLRRLGFDDADLVAPGSDRFYDGVVAHGAAEAVVEQLIHHITAGADHVALQILGDDSLPTLRALAPLLWEKP